MDLFSSVLSAPMQVGLEVTHRCNLRCDFCLLDCGSTGDDMPIEMIKKAIDLLYKAGIFGVILTGGEPLLIDRFEEVVDHMAKYGDSIEFSLNTNGVLLTEKLVSHLAAKMGKTFKLNFGMEGYDAKTYGISRGEPKVWNTIVENVKLAKDYGLNVGFMYCLTKKSLPFMLPSIIYYFEELKMQSGAVLFFMPIGRGKRYAGELQIPLSELEVFFKTIDRLRPYVPWFTARLVWGIYARWRVYLAYMREGVNVEELKDEVKKRWGYYPIAEAYGEPLGTACCHAGVTDLVIDPKGDVRPCFMLRGSPFVVGNIFTESLDKIWISSPILRKIRCLEIKEIGTPCSSCDINVLCCATCRACAYEWTGNLYAPDPNCPLVSKETYLKDENPAR
mgnify:CR=1 FL=1